MNLALEFWQELMEYRINAKKIGTIGKKYVQVYHKIRDIVRSGIVLNEKSRIAFEVCFSYLIKDPNFRVDNPKRIEHNLEGFVECSPTVAVSA